MKNERVHQSKSCFAYVKVKQPIWQIFFSPRLWIDPLFCDSTLLCKLPVDSCMDDSILQAPVWKMKQGKRARLFVTVGDWGCLIAEVTGGWFLLPGYCIGG